MKKPNFFQNAIGMFKDPHTPFRDKLMMVLGVVYIVSPIDIIPDYIVGFGELDDLGVLIATVRLFIGAYNRYVKRNRIVGEQTHRILR
jgi:uncharacterized membrane protein YkvA (DUF1232 family)